MSAPEGRVGRVLAAMEREGGGTLLLTPSSSLKYVLGGGPIVDERLFVLALSPGREPFLLANSLYELEAGSSSRVRSCSGATGRTRIRSSRASSSAAAIRRRVSLWTNPPRRASSCR